MRRRYTSVSPQPLPTPCTLPTRTETTLFPPTADFQHGLYRRRKRSYRTTKFETVFFFLPRVARHCPSIIILRRHAILTVVCKPTAYFEKCSYLSSSLIVFGTKDAHHVPRVKIHPRNPWSVDELIRLGYVLKQGSTDPHERPRFLEGSDFSHRFCLRTPKDGDSHRRCCINRFDRFLMVRVYVHGPYADLSSWYMIFRESPHPVHPVSWAGVRFRNNSPLSLPKILRLT